MYVSFMSMISKLSRSGLIYKERKKSM